LLAVGAVACLVAGGAWAYFTAFGSGSGPAQATTTEAVTIGAATPTSTLYPGGLGDLAATVSNPNSIPVHIPSLQLDTAEGTNGFSVDAGHSGCDVSTLSLATQDNGGAGWDVPPRVGSTDGSLPLDLTGAVSMGSGAGDACQGATFTVFLKVGP
jgi:hypothetical protein